MSLSLFPSFPSLPRAWSKCWSCAPHGMPGGPPPSASPTTITITRYDRWYRCVRRYQHHRRYQLSRSPSRFIVISRPRRCCFRTGERLSSSILPLCPTSPLPCRFLHRGVPPLRSSSVISVRSQSETRPLGVSPSLASLGREYAICPENRGSRRIAA